MTLKECLDFARKRETLQIANEQFWVYEDSYTKTKALLKVICDYVDKEIYDLLFGNAFLHYVITTKYEATVTIENPDGTTTTKVITNNLYDKYKIADKAFIVSSASDGSSSSSLHITESLNKGGFLMQDLIKTPYGEYVYSVLEQLNITVVLL